MNYAIVWLYEAQVGDRIPRGQPTCAVCRVAQADPHLRLSDKLRPTFTNRDLIDATSEHICRACAWYFDNSQALVMRSHWYISATAARQLATSELLPLLETTVEWGAREDFSLLVTRTRQKHVILRARLNAAGAKRLRVNFEESLVDVDNDFFKLVADLAALRKFHRWDEIKSDRYLPFAIARWGSFADFNDTRRRVLPWLRSPQFALAEFLYSPNVLEEKSDQLPGGVSSASGRIRQQSLL